MAKYRKKPVIIEAWLWDGELETMNRISNNQFVGIDSKHRLVIDTLEGQMRANTGDYIIKGIHGEYYPCKPDIFKESYEEVEK